MSAVYNVNKGFGDYIHYNYSNYVKYGLARSLRTDEKSVKKTKQVISSRSQTLEQAYRIEKNRIKHQIKAQQYKAIYSQAEAYMTALKADTSNEGVSVGSEQVTQQMKNMIIEYMSEITKQTVTESDIDFKSGQIKDSAFARLGSKITDDQLRQAIANVSTNNNEKKLMTSISAVLGYSLGKGQHYTNVSSWMAHINTINQAMITLNGSDNLSPQFQQLQKNLETIKKVINDLKKNLTSSRIPIETLNQVQIFNTNNIYSTTSNANPSTTMSLAQAMRAIAKSVLLAYTKAQLDGQLGEAMAYSAFQMARVQAEAGTKKIISKITGSQKGNVFISDASFSKYVDASQLYTKGFTRTSQPNGVVGWRTISNNVEAKVDVMVYAEDGVTKLMGLNVKNYNLTGKGHLKGVNLVKSTNLIYMLQQHTTFANHYANQTAYGDSGDNPPANVIMQANQVMKRMIFLLALTGGGMRDDNLSEEKANVFVINDKRKGGGVRVVPIFELYHKIIDFNLPVEIPLNDNQTWTNDGKNITKTQRITNLFMEIRKKQLSVSIPFTTIQRTLKI